MQHDNAGNEKSSQAYGEFIVRLGHELRTPLTSILGYAEILKAQAQPYLLPEHVRQLEIIERSGQAMLRLISSVADWSKLDSGRLACDPRDFDVAELFKAFADSLALTAAAKGLGFTLRVAPESTASFVTDPDLLRQIFSNLVSNAIKFTDHGRVAVDVACHDDSLEFTVSDTGPGIAAADQARVFQEFERLSTKGKDGSGLGLAIARGLVERLGGRVSLTSATDAGCRFEVRLPRLEVPPAEAPAAQLPAQPPPNSVVLIVDDEPDNRGLLMNLLASEGWNVQTCEGGLACLASVEEIRPGAILLDMAMPELDGFETARRLRNLAATRHVPIVAITALSGSDVERRILQSGCTHYLTKPFDFRQLTATLQQCLQPTEKAHP